MEDRVIKTGYIEFDRRFEGFSRREVTAIASRPGMGKTVYLINLAVNMVKENYRIAIFNLNENKEATLDKIACIIGKVNYLDCLDNRLTKDSLYKFINVRDYFINRILDANWLYINDTACTISEIILACAEQKLKYGLDAVLIDDMLRLRYFCKGGVGECVRLLKSLAEKLDIAVITTTQIVMCGDKKPGLQLVREKSLLKVAQKILLLNRMDIVPYEELIKKCIPRGATEIQVERCRGGLMGIYDFRFDSSSLLFYEPENYFPDDEEIPE